jgi:hypothetical protein
LNKPKLTRSCSAKEEKEEEEEEEEEEEKEKEECTTHCGIPNAYINSIV